VGLRCGYLGTVSEVRAEAWSASPQPEVDLELPAGAFGAVGRLVVAGVASRLGLTVDRIDELQLAVDETLRRPASRDALSLRITPTTHELRVRVGPVFVRDGERRDLERLLSTLVDDAATHDSGEDVWIDLRVARTARATA